MKLSASWRSFVDESKAEPGSPKGQRSSLDSVSAILPPRTCNPESDVPCSHHGHIAFLTYHVNNIELHVAEQGPPDSMDRVVLLHGFPGSWYMWSNQLRDLSLAGYRVMAPDLRGFGGSSRPDAVADYSLEAACDDLAALLDHFGWQDAVFVGTGIGALIASSMMMRAPERVRGVACLNGPLFTGGSKPMWRGERRAVFDVLQERVQVGPNEYMYGVATKCMSNSPEEALTALLESRAEAFFNRTAGEVFSSPAKARRESGGGDSAAASSSSSSTAAAVVAASAKAAAEEDEPLVAPGSPIRSDSWAVETVVSALLRDYTKRIGFER